MTLMSIDPSIATIGYSVWKEENLFTHGYYRVSGGKVLPLRERLIDIDKWVREKLTEFAPDLVVLEEQIFRSFGGSEKFGVKNIRNLVCAYTTILIAIPDFITVDEFQPSQWMRRRDKHKLQEQCEKLYGVIGNHNAIDAIMMAVHWFDVKKPKQRELAF